MLVVHCLSNFQRLLIESSWSTFLRWTGSSTWPTRLSGAWRTSSTCSSPSRSPKIFPRPKSDKTSILSWQKELRQVDESQSVPLFLIGIWWSFLTQRPPFISGVFQRWTGFYSGGTRSRSFLPFRYTRSLPVPFIYTGSFWSRQPDPYNFFQK